MNKEQLLERGIFKEQIRKELLDELKGYSVDWAENGEIIALRDCDWNGYVLIIPKEKYKELFGD